MDSDIYTIRTHRLYTSPSPLGASYNITSFPVLAYTMTLVQAIDERVSFLKAQINAQNKPLANRAFEIQIETIRKADTEKVALMVLQKTKQIENARDMETIEKLYTDLDALERLQRQVVKHIA